MTAEPSRPYPHALRAWTFVIILFVASVVSVIDRSVLNIVVDPVKASIGISDVQISLLQGLAFGIFYAAVGLPLGLTADRYSRRWLIIGGMSLWSAATVASGLAQSFGALFSARLLVGLGEAALSPAAFSLIGDLFPPDKRGRPIGVFLMGQSIALGLSISVAGFILQAAKAGRFHAAPLLGGLEPWRVVFVLCGLAGLVVPALMLTTREPVRRGGEHTGDLWAQITGCAGYMARNWAVFAPFYLGFAFFFAAVYGVGAWNQVMLMRGFGATPPLLGRWLGPSALLFGVVGPFAGGYVADLLAKRKAHAGKLLTLTLAPLAATPAVLAVFAPNLGWAIALVATTGAVAAFMGAVTFTALQSMTPANMRGVAVALTGLINTIIGATLGPLLVATFTQHLYKNPAMVGYSIATLAVPALLIGAGCFALAFIALRRQLKTSGEVARMAAV